MIYKEDSFHIHKDIFMQEPFRGLNLLINARLYVMTCCCIVVVYSLCMSELTMNLWEKYDSLRRFPSHIKSYFYTEVLRGPNLLISADVHRKWFAVCHDHCL